MEESPTAPAEQADRTPFYSEWAQERDISEDAGDAMRAAIEDGLA